MFFFLFFLFNKFSFEFLSFMASCFLTLFWDALCSFSILYFEIKKKKWLFFIYLLGTKNCFLMDMEESLFFSFQTKNKTQNTKHKKYKGGKCKPFSTDICCLKTVYITSSVPLYDASDVISPFCFSLSSSSSFSLLSCPPQLLDSTPSL